MLHCEVTSHHNVIVRRSPASAHPESSVGFCFLLRWGRTSNHHYHYFFLGMLPRGNIVTDFVDVVLHHQLSDVSFGAALEQHLHRALAIEVPVLSLRLTSRC